MIEWLWLTLPAVALVARYRQIDGRNSPDCQRYLSMAVGRRVPKPYCYRIFLPWLERSISWLPISTHIIMRALVVVGVVAALAASAWLALELGASLPVVAAILAILIATNSLVGAWIMFPWLADPWATALAVSACAVGEPISAAVLLALAATAKEAMWALGSLYLLLVHPEWWWAVLPGAALLVLLRLIIKAAPPDEEWLVRPLATAHAKKKRIWLSYGPNLGHLKGLPLVACWVLPSCSTWNIPVAVFALAWAQTLVAMDHARLIAAALPFVVPIVATHCEPWLLALWAVSSLFWPLETDYV